MVISPALIVVDMQNDFCPPVGTHDTTNFPTETDKVRMALSPLKVVETLHLLSTTFSPYQASL